MTATPGERTRLGWVPDDNTIGARLALIRQHMGWSNVARAAEASGVATETWRAWENGTNKNPRNYEKIIAKIASASGCDPGWLYGGAELEGMINLERLQSALDRGVGGPTALALSLRPEMAGAAGDLNHSYDSMTEQPRSEARTHAMPAEQTSLGGRPRDGRPIGRPRTAQRGPNPVRPARVPRARTP